jgi:hypothetical protein
VSRLPWREDAAVWLAPSQVGLALRRRGWRNALERHAHPAAVPHSADAALEALGPLAAAARPNRAHARIVVSNRFVRTALLPDGRTLRDAAERRVAAREVLRGVHGDMVDGWHVAVDDEAALGMPSAALDAGWLGRLRQQARMLGLQAVSVRPLLAPAAARAWSLLAGRPAWLLVTEPDGALLARIDAARGWQSLHTKTLDGLQDRAALARWVTRCALLDGLEPAELPLVHVAWSGAGQAPQGPPLALEGWDMQTLALDASHF